MRALRRRKSMNIEEPKKGGAPMTHAKNCVLSAVCTLADGLSCSRLCPSYIATHGFDGRGGRVGAASIPDGYRNITLGNSPAKADQAAIYRLLTEYVATFGRQFDGDKAPIKSLYLFSRTPGTGKTTTAAAVLHEWIIAHYVGSLRRGRAPAERPAYFLDVNEWQALYNGFTRPGIPKDVAEPHSREYYRREGLAKVAPFLVMDDIGVRDCTEGFRGDLHALINARVASGLPAVYTSNIPLEDLTRIYDERLANRVSDLCQELAFKGETKRGKR